MTELLDYISSCKIIHIRFNYDFWLLFLLSIISLESRCILSWFYAYCFHMLPFLHTCTRNFQWVWVALTSSLCTSNSCNSSHVSQQLFFLVYFRVSLQATYSWICIVSLFVWTHKSENRLINRESRKLLELEEWVPPHNDYNLLELCTFVSVCENVWHYRSVCDV